MSDEFESLSQDSPIQLDDEDAYEDQLSFNSIPPDDINEKFNHRHEQYIRVDEEDIKTVNEFLKIILHEINY